MLLQLKINTGPLTNFETFGIIGAVLNEQLDGHTSLTLETVGDIGQPYLIPPFARTELWVDGVLRFIGWLDEAPRSTNSTAQRITYKLNGPMRWLDRYRFTQTVGGLVVIGGNTNAAQTAVQAWRLAAQQILISDGNKLGTHLTWLSGTFAPSYQIPARPRSDITIAEAWKTLMSYAPGAHIRWSYDTVATIGKVQLNVDFSPANPTLFLNMKEYEIMDASVNPRYDLLVSSVVINYMRDNVLNSTQTSTVTGDADTLGADRTVTYTFDTSSILNVPTAGLANAIKNYRGRLHVDGSATYRGINWSHRVGTCWGFKGSKFINLASYKTILHNLQRDLFKEETRLDFGVPDEMNIFEVYNRSDFDRGSIPPISTPSYTGNVSNVPYTPLGGSSSGGGFNPGSLSFQQGIQTLSVNGGGIQASCTSGYNTDIQCGIITINGPGGSLSLDGDQLQGKTVSFREVENCDGQKMMILASAWY